MSDHLEHTPGPWKLNWRIAGGGVHPEFPRLEYVNIHYASNTGDVQNDLYVTGYMTRADAYLIAAAPELLTLAEQYAKECANCDGEGFTYHYVDIASPQTHKDCPDCAEIRAVIAKAKGVDPQSASPTSEAAGNATPTWPREDSVMAPAPESSPPVAGGPSTECASVKAMRGDYDGITDDSNPCREPIGGPFSCTLERGHAGPCEWTAGEQP